MRFPKLKVYLLVQSMNVTKALTQLGFVSARGLDNYDYGARLLSNQTAEQIHEMEDRCGEHKSSSKIS